MNPPFPEYLERLEAQVTHLERQYDELNEVVVQQGRELARLRQQLQRITASVEGLEVDRIKAHNPRPPHSVI